MKRLVSLITALSLMMSLLIILPTEVKAVYKAKIACVGDSITYGYGLDDPRSFPSQLGVLLQENYEVRNFGAGGKTLMSTGDTPYTQYIEYQPSLEYEGDIVLIMLGTNDAKYYNWHPDSSPAVLKRELKQLVQTYRDLPSKPTVFIMTSPTLFEGCHHDFIPSNVDTIAQLQREVAEEINAPLIDLHTFTADMEQYFEDKIHPNADGYALIADYIDDIIVANEGTLPGAPKDPYVLRNSSGRSIVMWSTGPKGGLPLLSFNVYINGEFYGNSRSTTFTVTKLTNGVTYEMTVTSLNANGESERSEVVILEPTADDPKVTGVEDGGVYDLSEVAPPKASWKKATSATLDGAEYAKDTEITAPGEHVLVITNENVTVTVTFTVIARETAAGDMDGDGEITVADALAVLRIAAKLADETPDALRVGDMDADGAITVSDALRVLRIAAKLA
ncbi:MAG: hypothetical protein IJL83_00570 [Clostridia bacterium]|nr:hypothetical protein [Clostridia bacterium]